MKLFPKGETGLDRLIQSVRIFSNDIKMEFGLSKCAYGDDEVRKASQHRRHMDAKW